MTARTWVGVLIAVLDLGLAAFLAYRGVAFGWPVVSLLIVMAVLAGVLIDPEHVRQIVAGMNPFGKRDA